YTFRPSDLGMDLHDPSGLTPLKDLDQEVRRFVSLLQGKVNGARADAAVLNAGLVFHVAGRADSIGDGVKKASSLLANGGAFDTLENWVIAQNRNPEEGRKRLEHLVRS
ncbi:MAG: anthranilate phosphoribosyltransferase, partial [Proteobacteria bacterium]|nr:anthranilate phosphoribosyltransferase [Pseudomonadota bacterium]